MKSRVEVEALATALGGMAVWGVLKGSVAARAGVRYGDIVTKVNGVQTPSIEQFLEARGLRDDGATLVLHRNGAEHRVELSFEGPRLTLSQIVRDIEDRRLLPVPRARRRFPPS